MSKRRVLFLQRLREAMVPYGTVFEGVDKGKTLFKLDKDSAFTKIIPKNISERKLELWRKWKDDYKPF